MLLIAHQYRYAPPSLLVRAGPSPRGGGLAPHQKVPGSGSSGPLVSPVARGGDEVQAAVDAAVGHLSPVDPRL